MSAQQKATGGLSLGLDLKSLGKRTAKLPPKPIINLAPAEAKRQVKMMYIAVALLAAVGLAAFYKFMIMDKQDELKREQQNVAQLRQELEEAQARLEELSQNDVEAEYYHLTYDGMTEDELSLVDRVDIMDMLERVMDNKTSTQAWSLSGNELTMTLDTITLEEANQTVQRFLAEDLVLYCTINTAASDAGGEEEDAEETVTASIVVYLAIPTEEEEELEPEGFIVVEGMPPEEGGA